MARQPRTPDADAAEPDDDVRVPGPERAGGAVQGAGRVRDQRREHDQAGKLHARRPFRRHAVPVRRRTAIPNSQALRRALEELSFFSSEVRVLGVYPAAPFRLEQGR